MAAVPFALAIIGIIVGFTLLVMAIENFYNHWDDFKAALERAWTAIKNLFNDGTAAVKQTMIQWGSDLSSWWTGFWNGIYQTMENIWGKIEAIVNSIKSAVSSVGGAVSGVAGAVGAGVSSAVSSAASVLHVNDAIITPSGQVIQTDVSDYLFATKNPGAIANGGGNGGITVNILGGSYLDQGGATMIATALATQIGRQIKLTNFR